MAPQAQVQVTELLSQLHAGDQDAVRQLLPLVYRELRELAELYLRRERRGHTLQATALVHEAFLKLVGQQHAHFENRVHFLSVAAQAMRRILIDYARGHLSQKRGGDRRKLSLDEISTVLGPGCTDLLAVDEALTRLGQRDELQGKIVELRFFGGLTIEEAARVLGISTTRVKREWRIAQAWLYREVCED